MVRFIYMSSDIFNKFISHQHTNQYNRMCTFIQAKAKAHMQLAQRKFSSLTKKKIV